MGENIVFKIDIDDTLHIEFLNQTHAQDLFEVADRNREFLREWLNWPDLTTEVEDTQKFITASLNRYIESGDIEAPIFYNKKIVGIITLLVKKELGIAKGEIGYWLDKEYLKKGIITKCAKKMLEIGFNRYNLDKIIIRCATRNPNSCNVAERLGFNFDGTLRVEAKIGDVVEDLNIYSILKEEYEKLKV